MTDEKNIALTDEETAQVSGGVNPFVKEGDDIALTTLCRLCKTVHALKRSTPTAFPKTIGDWDDDEVYLYTCDIARNYYYEKVLPNGTRIYYMKSGEPLS